MGMTTTEADSSLLAQGQAVILGTSSLEQGGSISVDSSVIALATVGIVQGNELVATGSVEVATEQLDAGMDAFFIRWTGVPR